MLGLPFRHLPLALCTFLPSLACDPVQPDRPGGAASDLTVPQVQNPADPEYPGTGSRVVLDDVIVTAVDNYDEDGSGRVGNVWVAEPAGGAWSGVQLFDPSVIPSRASLVPGDIVQAIGTLDEFVLLNPDGSPQDPAGTLTELSGASVQKIGETYAPLATTIPEADLVPLGRDSPNPAAEQWEDCLVRLENVEMAGGYDRYGEAPTSLGVAVASDLYLIPDLAAGTRLRSLTGIVTYFFGFSLMPRGPQDVELE
ncbi:MAG: hypothetical protein HY907_16290 [Deltaproteobacteria bacterium]|nr:hypothetical protein [Deltaproteobacteria bacterium]